jgi:hypothetical protein
MKKLLLTFSLFILTFCTAVAPPSGTIFIPEATPIIYHDAGSYRPLIEALMHWESGHDPFALNRKEDAYGAFQIRAGKLEDYNKANGTNYILTDCYNLELSKKIFLYFTNHTLSGKPIPQKSWEHAAKDWNGSGPMTITYWEEVKKRI